MYCFKIYSNELKDDWFSIANQEINHCVNAIDEEILEKNNNINIILYKKEIDSEKINSPVAIFVSNGVSFKWQGIIKELDANSGGLFIKKEFVRKSLEIKYFFYNEVVLKYFRNKLKVDFIHFMPSSLNAIEKPESVFLSNPTRNTYLNNNSILYMDLKDNFIKALKLVPRQEIKKGIKFINENIIISDKNDKILDFFVYLDKIKAQRLSIKPFDRIYFEGLIQSKFYEILICLDKDTMLPIGGFIYSLVGTVGDSIYIAGTDQERKHCVNKGLTYLAMEACKTLGAKYFITGHGYTDGNMTAVTKYHRSISTDEVSCGMYRSPISFKARLYTCLLLFKK